VAEIEFSEAGGAGGGGVARGEGEAERGRPLHRQPLSFLVLAHR